MEPGKYDLDQWMAEQIEWLEQSGTFENLFEHSKFETEQTLASSTNSVAAIQKMGSNLSSLGSWHQTAGALAIVRDDPTGWGTLYKSIRYRTAGYWINYFESGGIASDPAIWLTLAIALGDMRLAQCIAKMLINGVPEHICDYSETAFEPFAVWLYGESIGKQITPLAFDPPEYRDEYSAVCELWYDPPALAQELQRLCHVHLTSDFSDEEGSVGLFWAPYDICPLEIVAIQRVRAAQGLPNLPFEHPLMTSPLAKIPTAPPHVDADPLFDEVMRRARQVYPELPEF